MGTTAAAAKADYALVRALLFTEVLASAAPAYDELNLGFLAHVDEARALELRLDPLRVIRARRMTAERLGDAEAIERWRGREAALLERTQGDRAFALYRMLG